MRHDCVVVGAGPCGLAAAYELHLAGHRPTVLERSGWAGGLSSSFQDSAGFVWDQGAHVAFSYHGEFEALLDDVMDGDVLQHERSSYIVHSGRMVPYPFQHNLSALADEDAVECMIDMIERPDRPVVTYDDYLVTNFGTGIADRFLRPYASKLWTVPSTEMSAEWVTHRVAKADWRTVLGNLVHRRPAPGWGPNSTFSYPGSGGIGEPFRRLAGRLPNVRYRQRVVRVDLEERILLLDSGERLAYDTLISTMPLTALVAATVRCPDEVREAARALRYNKGLMVGVGATGTVPKDWSWLYFPDPEYPFYRITNLGLFSPRNLPEPHEEHVSYLAEIALPAHAPWPDAEAASRDTVAGLLRSGLLPDRDRVVSVEVRMLPMAYPIPTLDRTAALATILEYLEQYQVFSRGRFGLWMYEYGNMDHAVKMGTDVARRVLSGTAERILLPHLRDVEVSAAEAVY